MTEYRASCDECDEAYEAENEESAVGWMFGHSLRTEHTDVTKEEING